MTSWTLTVWVTAFFCKLLSLFLHFFLSRIPNQKVFIVVVRICVFLQSSPVPPPIVSLIYVPLTVIANGVSSVAVRLSPSHHSRHHSSVVHVLFAFSFCPSCIVNRLKQVSHYIFTLNCWVSNGNPPHYKHDWEVDSVDMNIEVEYNEFCEVGFIEVDFKVGKLKMHVWCLRKILIESFCLVNIVNCFLHVILLRM